MKKAIMSVCLAASVLANSTAFAVDEGPFTATTAAGLRARVSSSGDVIIFGMPSSANCSGNKVVADATLPAPTRQMIVSIVTAAQLADRSVDIWIERAGSQCNFRFVQVS